jgi:hypothetical protein
MKSEGTEEIIKRLNILIAVVLDQSPSGGGTSTADKIRKLTDLGVSSAKIAEILNKPVNYVTASLAQRSIKRRTRKRSAKDNG